MPEEYFHPALPGLGAILDAWHVDHNATYPHLPPRGIAAITGGLAVATATTLTATATVTTTVADHLNGPALQGAVDSILKWVGGLSGLLTFGDHWQQFHDWFCYWLTHIAIALIHAHQFNPPWH